MPPAFYSENDAKAAAWLGELIGAGHLPPGRIDTRDIREVTADDVGEATEAHFFAGIGGWPLALSLAGWPVDAPVWTGSCPCQPYSSAGKGGGDSDPRNLWPEFRRLISECRPPVVIGEQVASKAGREWLAGVRADLEALGYVVGAADLCAAGVGAPHIRQRLFWVADSGHDLQPGAGHGRAGGLEAGQRPQPAIDAQPSRVDGGVAEPVGERIRGEGHGAIGGSAGGVQGADGEWERLRADAGPGRNGMAVGLADADGYGLGEAGQRIDATGRVQPERDGGSVGMGDTLGPGSQGCGAGVRGRSLDRGGRRPLALASGPCGLDDAAEPGPLSAAYTRVSGPEAGAAQQCRGDGRRPPGSGGLGDFWSASDLIPCRDGKSRRVEPGTFPLAHGVPGRVGLLRGYGNAIVPQLAAEFVAAYMEARALH